MQPPWHYCVLTAAACLLYLLPLLCVTSPVPRGLGRRGYVKKSGERMGDEFSVFTFPFSDCHTPSGALLLVPLTQRDKVDEYLNLKLSPPPFRFPFSHFRLASPYFPPLS